MATVFQEAVVFQDAVTFGAGFANKLARSNLSQESFVAYPIDLTSCRVWDAIQTNLPGTAAADDLAILGNTFGTGSPSLVTSDAKQTTVTQYARFLFSLPAEYDATESVRLRFYAGMKTTVSDGTATIDAQVYKSDKYAGIGSDLCATAAQSINGALLSASPTPIDFTITASSLSAGDILDCRVAIAITDTATGTAVIGEIGAIEFDLDIRG